MASVKIPEQKVILCGEYGVGKSSLFRRFAFNLFIPSSDKQSTLGLDHFNKEYSAGERKIKVSRTFGLQLFASIYFMFCLFPRITRPLKNSSSSYCVPIFHYWFLSYLAVVIYYVINE